MPKGWSPLRIYWHNHTPKNISIALFEHTYFKIRTFIWGNIKYILVNFPVQTNPKEKNLSGPLQAQILEAISDPQTKERACPPERQVPQPVCFSVCQAKTKKLRLAEKSTFPQESGRRRLVAKVTKCQQCLWSSSLFPLCCYNVGTKLWDNWGWESCDGWSGQCLSLRDREFNIQGSLCLSVFWRSAGRQRLMIDPNPSAWEWAELRQRQQKFLLTGLEGSPSDRLQLYTNSDECPCLPVLLRSLEKNGDFIGLLSGRIFHLFFF